MARRAARYVLPVVPLNIKPISWGAGTTMYRVHETIYAAGQFNPSPKGNSRFSPIHEHRGT
jgi:hypothetical protein